MPVVDAPGVSGAPNDGPRLRPPPPPPTPAKRATAVLVTEAEPAVSGHVTFQALPSGGVRVDAEFSGLEPGSVHGLHVRVGTECGDSAAELPHFDGDPTEPEFEGELERTHGNPAALGTHLGDLGNVSADEFGNALLISGVRGLAQVDVGGAFDVLGRVVVLQRGKDDFHSQEPDNSGGVLACGTIALLPSE